MLSIQLATKEDVDEICSFDQISQQENARVEFIRSAVFSKSCYVAVDEQIKGYAVLDYSFLKQALFQCYMYDQTLGGKA